MIGRNGTFIYELDHKGLNKWSASIVPNNGNTNELCIERAIEFQSTPALISALEGIALGNPPFGVSFESWARDWAQNVLIKIRNERV